MVKTLCSAPSDEIVAGCSVKASAVYEDFILSRLEIIEILSLVIAPVVDSHDDILFVYPDIIDKTLPDLISHRLHRIRDNECLISIKSFILRKIFLGDHLDPGLFINRTLALIGINECINIHAKPLKSPCKIMSCNACTIDQAVRTFLYLLDIHLHVTVQVSVL